MPPLPLPLRLDRTGSAPLRTQLADQIREIVDVRLGCGRATGCPAAGRSPPTSASPAPLAEQAYDQLVAEGWLEGRHGVRDLRRRQR